MNYTYQSPFLHILSERGLIYQLSDQQNLDLLMSGKKPVCAYIGFDATAPSLHVGSLTQIMKLRQLQKSGHKPIVLMGGGTTKIGDPSGRSEERQLLTQQVIDHNISEISTIFKKFLQFGDGPTDAIIVNNDEWLSELEFIPFLREIGSHFSINRMLSFDSVRLRLEREQPLSFIEFNYMILQAYDFLKLAERYDCALQMGGSDQWGNIVNGIDLARRVKGLQLFALTSPLLQTASGTKMGKTASGAVWLSEKLLSPYDYWQFWRNTDDADIGRFLRLFTELPIKDIEKLETLEGQELNEAKKILADETTRLCHGAENTKIARQTAERTFEQGHFDVNLPCYQVKQETLLSKQGIGLLD
ncbi:MAG: tyrosine--tRNA ligase, partial [Pseudomonadota bacterium]